MILTYLYLELMHYIYRHTNIGQCFTKSLHVYNTFRNKMKSPSHCNIYIEVF